MVKAFNEISCPRVSTLDFETLKKHLISQHANQIFKNEIRSNGEDLSMDSSMLDKQQTQLSTDKFSERLKKLLSRNGNLFSLSAKMYALPTREINDSQL